MNILFIIISVSILIIYVIISIIYNETHIKVRKNTIAYHINKETNSIDEILEYREKPYKIKFHKEYNTVYVNNKFYFFDSIKAKTKDGMLVYLDPHINYIYDINKIQETLNSQYLYYIDDYAKDIILSVISNYEYEELLDYKTKDMILTDICAKLKIFLMSKNIYCSQIIGKYLKFSLYKSR